MKTTFAVLTFAVAALANQGPPANEYTDGQPQVPTGWSSTSSTAPATYATTSSVVAPVSSSAPATYTTIVPTTPAPYPVPGGNSTIASTGTGVATLPVSSSLTTATYGTTSSPAGSSPTAPAATGAASALQIGGAAAFAGLLALLA